MGSSDTDFGSAIVVWRYNSTGALDTSFGGNGYVLYENTLPSFSFASFRGCSRYNEDKKYAISLDAQGRILIAGFMEGSNSLGRDVLVLRYRPDGVLEGGITHHNAAGGDGNDIGYAVTVDSSGRILVAGKSKGASGTFDMVIWRFK